MFENPFLAVLQRKKRSFSALLAACLLWGTCLGLLGCDTVDHPDAVLHVEGDKGYISCVSASSQLHLDLSSRQAFVYDVENECYLYLKGETQVLYPASTAKLLTVLYALTLLTPEELITPGEELELVEEGSSIAYIKTHHTLTAEMLIEGILLPSGNDAAYALAAAAGRKLMEGTEEDRQALGGKEAVALFMKGMNAYAEELGLCGSSFLTPDGFYRPEQYSTLEDMTLIARLAAQNELIMRYAGMSNDSVVYASGHTNRWLNSNLLLREDSDWYCSDASVTVTGLKTGSAGKGNYSLIVTAQKGGRNYIIGLFSANEKNDRFRDALNILKVLPTA